MTSASIIHRIIRNTNNMAKYTYAETVVATERYMLMKAQVNASCQTVLQMQYVKQSSET